MTDFEEPKRFWSKVDVCGPDKCWEWLAHKHYKGYGEFRIHYKKWYAHRVAWVLTYGSIPEGFFVCHHCDNPGCCNPYHLFLGTDIDNKVDALKKGRFAKKLTSEDVLEIKELLKEGALHWEVAGMFGVSRPAISSIKEGKTWAWLAGKEEA